MGALIKSDRQLGRKYMTGDLIFQEGDPVDGLYVIQNGCVEVRFSGPPGSARVLPPLGKGQLLGEASLFGKERTRCATARALSESSIIKVDEKAFINRLHQDPSLAFNVLKNMAEKIRLLGEDRMVELPFASPSLLAGKDEPSAHPLDMDWSDGIVRTGDVGVGAGFRILMIEDDPDYQELAKAWLPGSADAETDALLAPFFSLSQTDSLGKAMDILSQEKFDLILLDLNLPDSAGPETVTRLLGRVADAPIVVFSGTDDEDLVVLATRHGAEDFLVKGQVTKAQFLRSIRSALERHRLAGFRIRRFSHGSALGDIGSENPTQSRGLPWLRNILKNRKGIH